MPDVPTHSRPKSGARRRWAPPALALAAAASLLVLAGCATETPRSGDDETTPGLQQFMEQELAFGPCDESIVDDQPPVPELIAVAESAECAMLTVPMDYDEPDGDTIELAVTRNAATGDPEARIGSVVVNPGGPGFQATTFGPLVAALWAGGPVTERFDIVGFDPRGVGLSRPAIDCYTDEERDADEPVSAFGAWTEDAARAIVDKCADGSGGEEFLKHIGTRDVARDLDVLRAALGDEKLTFAGTSYGTRLGSVYAEMFPENVRALVLDGAVDPRLSTAERRVLTTAGIKDTFDSFAEYCATLADCPLGSDPAGASAAAQELLQPLIDEPLIAADGREVGFLAAGEGIVSGLYSEDAWPAIVAGLQGLQAGQPDALLALRDGYYGRTPTGEYSNDIEASFAINCVDEDRLSADDLTAVANELDELAPFLSTGQPPVTQDGCEFWPTEPTLGFPYATDIDGLPEVLVVSATGDPVT
ncbi:MAG TPA: alpha/beta fold hydrolase, partial [Microcella sp.]|nr:alpha/beta fold hydrolase [Microcella sp.]